MLTTLVVCEQTVRQSKFSATFDETVSHKYQNQGLQVRLVVLR